MEELLYIWFATYSGFLVLYFAIAWFVLKQNGSGKYKKIQPEQGDKEISAAREIRQSVVSLLSVSFFLSIGIYLNKNNLTLFAVPELTVFSFFGGLIVSLLIFDAWFYWGHRMLHRPWLLKHIHLWHHKAKSPIVWSNNSDSLLDNCVLQSYWIIACAVLPVPYVVFIVHKIYDQVTGMIGHSGYEYAGKNSVFPNPMVGVTFHDQHHEKFSCNYATHFSIWDRMMGTLHRDYETQMLKNGLD